MVVQTSAPSWRRPAKRKRHNPDALAPPLSGADSAAKVELEDELTALRDALATQKAAIDELCLELEEERSASASATSEAMLMIHRLQREKAEALLDARQFKAFAEDKMAHDQQQIFALEDLILRRDEALRSLGARLQCYRQCLVGFGIDPDSVGKSEGFVSQVDDAPELFEYPPLRCGEAGVECGFDKFSGEDVEELVQGSGQLGMNVVEKGVDLCSVNHSGENGEESKKGDEFPVVVDRPGDDCEDLGDRVCEIEAVHCVPVATVSDDSDDVIDEVRHGRGGGNFDIEKLCMRLQALEADKESIRQALASMRTGKAEFVLLKEMALQLGKEKTTEMNIVEEKKKANKFLGTNFSWTMSFVLWKKKPSRGKYTFGLSSGSVGLLVLLDKSSNMSNFRCSRRRQARAQLLAI